MTAKMFDGRIALSFVALNFNILLSHAKVSNADDYTVHKAFNFTWYQARDFCKAYGGDLAYINDQTEQSNLGAWTGYSGEYWIGLNDIASEGTYIWSGGFPLSITAWKSGEPNDAAGGEDCVFIISDISFDQWLDGKCTDKKNFICKYSSTKPSMTLTANIAKGKPTSQKSTSDGGLSSRAVDGRRDTTYAESNSCTHTKRDHKPWWRVDLLAIKEIVKVKITNREDCCSSRLRNFEIKVGNNANDPNHNELCYYYATSLGTGGTKEIECDSPIFGRYVFVALRITEYLTLCEVEVYAVGGNMARGMPTKQSSTMSAYGNSSKAVDGKRTTNFHSHSCTHTNYENKPWWRVDLQWSRDVHRVLLTNRGDCCSDRLAYFDISVGNIDNNPGANQLCYSYNKAMGTGQTKSFSCYSVLYGRYVYVQLMKANFLTLCEVEVYGWTGYSYPQKKRSGGFPGWIGGIISVIVGISVVFFCRRKHGRKKPAPDGAPAPVCAPVLAPALAPPPAPAPVPINPAPTTTPPANPATGKPAATSAPPAETIAAADEVENQTPIVGNEKNQPELAPKKEEVHFSNIALARATESNAIGTTSVLTTSTTPYQGQAQPFSCSYYAVGNGNVPIAVLPSSLMPDAAPPSYHEATGQGIPSSLPSFESSQSFRGFHYSSPNAPPVPEFGFEMTPYPTATRLHSPTAPTGHSAGGIPSVEEPTQSYDNGAYMSVGAGN